MNKQLSGHTQVMQGYTALTAEAPVTIKGGCLETDMRGTSINAIALLDDKYTEKEKSGEEKKKDLAEKQKVPGTSL